ncbi:dihydrolipoyllysine-residue succinyltransferase [Candidatus Methylacidiphilum fumarolicum]|uniref:Dihydrolipoyllysine-residue succinyltransferase n=2 Tax=Candidatus Methylacidiphilum fumarolicum TaxID=591154 RepID=I0K1J4_METFB|nr:2-oxoglutarate dehydrogenase complex dihydrolipoyllysine-residue succinyltransferase [Candidatus Methylacidiphilum fumarolicum]MBW6415487.1 2-oxoglutarate dehydrogenase complex dihydrolipoyllysine-residue succinyltransferase [Candidatus Methylacidiphilum fumarolicum]TFE68543.1 pyruvate dehydrogenase [Candidatus Methylacidiphilum fumarolicum]TFE73229.1 dihydrolipoyllysine-residue succinyltransferase [Candidatus Methylacidiphilum fumarolicum]TFE73256.1 dihydrolipoyllysine-residue succinyltrans
MDIKMPSVGESIESGLIGKWLKKEGERVQSGDALCEIETEKITTEIYAEKEGILHILVKEGSEVKVGQTIAQLEELPSGKMEQEPSASIKEEEEKEEKTVLEPQKELIEPVKKEEEEEKASVEAPLRRPGRITKEEALQLMEEEKEEKEEAKEVEAFALGPQEKRKPLSPIRKKIAQRLLEAHIGTAHLTTFNEVDMSTVLELRKNYGKRFEEKYGVKLGLMSFFVRAVVEALKKIPEVGARIEEDELVYPSTLDLGIAVATEKGLIVPVIRSAENLSFAQIEKTIQELAIKARGGKITLEDIEGGVFTITNGGVFGSMLSTPILNPPQSGILGMHAIKERPVAINGKVEIRPVMYLALTYDHRVIDGKEAVSFLVLVKEFIEQPASVLLEV